MSLDSLLGPVSGAVAALCGVGLSEWLRRKSRSEQFAQAVFERRLVAFEDLFHAMHAARSVLSEALMATGANRGEADERVFEAGLKIAELSDRHSLYIEEIGLHCIALWLSPSEILQIDDALEREAAVSEFQKEYSEALQMIRDLSGLSSVERVFESVTNTRMKNQSPVVSRIRELQSRLSRP